MTTISRLHNFDGSSTPAGEVYYIEYTTMPGSRSDQAVITNAVVMDADKAKAAAAQYNQQAQPGTGAAAVSPISSSQRPISLHSFITGLCMNRLPMCSLMRRMT